MALTAVTLVLGAAVVPQAQAQAQDQAKPRTQQQAGERASAGARVAKPGRPSAVTAAARPGGALVRWKAPGGAAATAFVIKSTPGGKTVRTGTRTSFVVGGLSNGKAYRFSVAAVNAAGTGVFSAWSAAVTPRPAAKPGQVPQVSATAGYKQVKVGWKAAPSGGAPVTAYRVRAVPGGRVTTVQGFVRTVVLTGLTDGRRYTVEVVAVNRVGQGPAGKSKPVTPNVTVPEAPSFVQAAPAGSGVRVSWQPPAQNGGSPVTGYVVRGAGRTVNAKATVRSVVVTGVPNGTLRSFTVAAKNAKGAGPAVASPLATADAALQPHVTVLSQASTATLTEVLTDGTLRFKNPPAQVTALAPGSVVVLGSTAAAPQGMLAEVRYVAGDDPADYRVGTRPAALDQVFSSTAFGAKGALRSGPGSSFTAAREGVVPVGKAAGLPGLSLAVNTNLYKDSRGASLNVKGTVTVQPNVDFTAHITCCFHADSHFRGTVQTSSSLKLTAAFDHTFPERSFVLGTYHFAPIDIQAGPVPIVLLPTLTVSLAAKGKVSAGLSVEAGQTVTLGADITTKDAKVTARPIVSASTYFAGPTVYGETSVSAGPQASLNISVDGLPGPSLTDKLWVLDFAANPSKSPCWTLSVRNQLSASYKLEVLSKTLVDWSRDLLDNSTVLARQNDPCLPVVIAPALPRVQPGGTVHFKATVLGVNVAHAQWLADGGSISSSGLYTAPQRPGVYKVTAVSPADGLKPESRGTTSVTVGVQPPDPPTNVQAQAGGKGEATVSWSPVANDGGSPVTGYTVTANPGGSTVSAGASATTAHFTGLTPKAIYTFTVRALNAAGTSLPSSPSGPVLISDGSDIQVGEGLIQVKLIWDNDNDEDLHVIEPGGTEIWYGARGPTSTGGVLDRDDNVGVCGVDSQPGGVENVYWPQGATPAHGTYTVKVVQYRSCGTPSSWIAEVRIGDRLIERQTGLASGSFTFTYPS